MHVGVYLLNCLPAYLPINLPTLPSIWRAWLVIEQQMLGTKCAKTIVFTMVSDPNLVAYTSQSRMPPRLENACKNQSFSKTLVASQTDKNE